MNKNKLVLAVVGMPGAGKSVVCDYLSQKGYPAVRFGAVTDEGVKAAGRQLNPANEKQFREQLRQELGMAAYAIKIEPKIDAALKHSQTVILDGLYSWEEYIYLKAKFPGLKLLAVYARPAIRYQRLESRVIRPLTASQARERDEAEIVNLNKGGPIALADYLVTNDVDQAALFVQLDGVLTDVTS